MSIRTFRDAHAQLIWNGERNRKLPSDLQQRAFRKLRLIDAATSYEALQSPPSNRLHPLKDDRAGQLSVSINMKWRICFVWKDGDAYDVEITDYH